MDKAKLRGLLGLGTGKEPPTFFVPGSGLVPVPADRLNEIPKVIAESHALDAERAYRNAIANARRIA